MVTVAVAGGTGGIGKTMVEELARQGKHKTLVLSRRRPHCQIVRFQYLPETTPTNPP
ncbi:hypothetical protein EK21DRAFT_116859 [Setomelanomma holmii]|uniref:Ketoreductase (KR) domain-containing protein n=1 Tax=Setomelanomma holmii TaxID=210430 RepID=A0A9P4LI96_9PLEO|nr:hypothetical protein EK21DRAFT_116859 [Setomelanomma holmii]